MSPLLSLLVFTLAALPSCTTIQESSLKRSALLLAWITLSSLSDTPVAKKVMAITMMTTTLQLQSPPADKLSGGTLATILQSRAPDHQEKDTGKFRTPGVPDGVRMVTSESRWLKARASVAQIAMPPLLSSVDLDQH